MQKIQKAAGESESRRVRDEAQKELARLELALRDNLAELESTNRSPTEAAQAARVGEDDVQRQWALNDRLIQESQDARKNLRDTHEAREKKEKDKVPAAPSKQEQSFQDATEYLKRGWRGGKAQMPVQARQAVEAPAAGEASLRDLLERTPFRGLAAAPLAERALDHEVAEPSLSTARRG